MREILQIICFIQLCLSAIPLTNQKVFSNVIKQTTWPLNKELYMLNHTCTIPPCTLTQVYIPCVISRPCGRWNLAEFHAYIDGETHPSVNVTLAEMANMGPLSADGSNADNPDPTKNLPHDNEPWGYSLFGHTAWDGGVYSHVRIPFLKSIKTAVVARKDPTCKGSNAAMIWSNIRGVEGLPVVLGEFQLPDSAKLQVYRFKQENVAPFDFITFMDVPEGYSGALLMVRMDLRPSRISSITGENFQPLEACIRYFPDGTDTPMFISSGTEDYFLSTCYFEMGMFKTVDTGLTYFDNDKGTLTVYKVHLDDPIMWHDGMKMVSRNCEKVGGCQNDPDPLNPETSTCPNMYCDPKTNTTRNAWKEEILFNKINKQPGTSSENIAYPPANYEILTWYYTWPKDDLHFTGHSNINNLSNKQKIKNNSDVKRHTKLFNTIKSLNIKERLKLKLYDKLLNGDAKLEALLETIDDKKMLEMLLTQHKQYK